MLTDTTPRLTSTSAAPQLSSIPKVGVNTGRCSHPCRGNRNPLHCRKNSMNRPEGATIVLVAEIKGADENFFLCARVENMGSDETKEELGSWPKGSL